MSRTEGINLPRLPTSHTRVTSSKAIQPHAAGRVRAETRRRTLSEPSYTAYVGTPRQDIPHPVLRDAAMFDDVFDKEGRLLSSRNVVKFTSPLNTVGYNSLNDPHCRKLFLNNRKLRSHLINLGLITDDLKVVASTREQRQKIRAHELLERKESLAQRLEQREKQRLERLSQPFRLPQTYQESVATHEERRQQWAKVQEMKTKKIMEKQEEERRYRAQQLEQKRQQLAAAMEEARLQEQARRNAIRAQQELAEIRAYEKAYGKLANWHRESDRIHNRMVAMRQKHDSSKRQRKLLSESFPPKSQSIRSPQSSVVDVRTLELPQLIPSKKESAPLAGEQVSKQQGLTKGREEVKLETAPPPTVEVAEPKAEKEEEKETGSEEGESEEEEGRKEEVTFRSKVEEPALQGRDEESSGEEGGEGGGEGGRGEEEKAGRGEVDEAHSPPSQAPPPAEVTLLPEQLPGLLGPEEAKEELTRILIEAFYSVEGEEGTGYLTVEDFLQVLCSRDLGFQLEEQEQLYIAGQVNVYGNGIIPYVEVAPLLPDLLLQIFTQRAEQSMQQYGYYTEEQWVQIYPVAGSVVYLNKLSGTMQYVRPDDFRPYLKDDAFEDSVVDFFETADRDRDGVIDYEDFYNLLASPVVASRVYRSQMEQLLGLYQTYSSTTGGRMGLAEFSPVASSLLLMIYQNAYPDVEEWIELDSRKFGPFWLNKNTGETILAQQLATEAIPVALVTMVAAGGEGGHTEMESRDSEGEKPQLKSRKKKKRKKRIEFEDSSAPPKLTPRPKSRPTQYENDSIDPPPLPTQSSSDAVRGPRKESSRSRLRESPTVETIPEEDETALEQSWSAGTGKREEEEEEEEEQKISMAERRERTENSAGERAVMVQAESSETSGGTKPNEELAPPEKKNESDVAVGTPDGPNESFT